MNGAQITIFDLIYPDKINPIREVAKQASPYWTTSKKKIIDLCDDDPDIKAFAKAVRHEYCPYGCAGHYSRNNVPNRMQNYDMRADLINVCYTDEQGNYQKRSYSWEDFAREIADLIWSGQYEEDH